MRREAAGGRFINSLPRVDGNERVEEEQKERDLDRSPVRTIYYLIVTPLLS